jgi:fucose permease
MGLVGGVWMARIPAAKAQVHLSDGTLGIALFGAPVGLVLGAALAERLVDRVGSTTLCRITGVGSCIVAVTAGLTHNLPELLATLFGVGVFGGTLDVSQNAQGVRVEAGYGRPVMSSMHACYSLGAIVGSLAGGAFAAAGVGLLPSLAIVGLVGALIDGSAGPWLLPNISRRSADARPAAASRPEPASLDAALPRLGPASAGAGSVGRASPALGGAGGTNPDQSAPALSAATATTGPAAAAERKRVRRLVLALGVLGVCALVTEGSAGDWSAVYLRDNLGASAALAAFGFSAFSAAMTVGRGLGDRLIHKLGVVPVVRTCGVLATVGLGTALATGVPAVAMVGLTVFGAGLSVVVPQVFAAGGRADPLHPGSGLAKVVGVGYTGMAAGPAIIGLIADNIGLHLALVIPLVLAAWIAVAAPALRPPAAGEDDARLPAAVNATLEP